MERRNNYLIQASQAKQRFLTYDQDALVRKFHLLSDEDYIYVNFLCYPHRIHRATGDLEYRVQDRWQDGNSFEEVMTLLDLLCDSQENRHLSGQWQNMQSFGLQFHRDLLEDTPSPIALQIDAAPARFHHAFQVLGSRPIAGGDFGYETELFDGLTIGLLFWYGDEEFAPRLRYLWDCNARMYIRYETMYYAVALLERRLLEAVAAL